MSLSSEILESFEELSPDELLAKMKKGNPMLSDARHDRYWQGVKDGIQFAYAHLGKSTRSK